MPECHVSQNRDLSCILEWCIIYPYAFFIHIPVHEALVPFNVRSTCVLDLSNLSKKTYLERLRMSHDGRWVVTLGNSGRLGLVHAARQADLAKIACRWLRFQAAFERVKDVCAGALSTLGD